MPCFSVFGLEYDSNDGQQYFPCDPDAFNAGNHTACCAQGDLCLTNGLCQSQSDSKQNKNLYWRNGCTDRTFEDPSCPKFCENEEPTLGAGKQGHVAFYCLQSSNWCCSSGRVNFNTIINQKCCNENDLQFRAEEPVVYATAQFQQKTLGESTAAASSIYESKSTLLTTVPPSQSELAANEPAGQSSSGLSSGAKIGIGIAVPLVVAFIIGILVLLFLRQKRLRQGASISRSPHQRHHLSPAEMCDTSEKHEVASRAIYELDEQNGGRASRFWPGR